MKRKTFLKHLGLAGGIAVLPTPLVAAPKESKAKPVLTIAHITDVHIRPEDQIPSRAKRCLDEVLSHKIDFILNTGDSIHDASYDNVTYERVMAQWAVWDSFVKGITYDIFSCIGNHDPWWKAPSKDHEMYGISYVAKRLNMPHRYYTFKKSNWHFFVLDGNHPGIKLDQEQLDWLKSGLDALAPHTPVLLMSHYPILTVTSTWEGGQHGDHKELKQLFYQHKDKVKVCLSGHQHLLDRAWYNGVNYFCNGAMSGFWWGKGDAKSAAPYYVQETPPGYALLRLYQDGRVENEYHPFLFEI